MSAAHGADRRPPPGPDLEGGRGDRSKGLPAMEVGEREGLS